MAHGEEIKGLVYIACTVHKSAPKQNMTNQTIDITCVWKTQLTMDEADETIMGQVFQHYHIADGREEHGSKDQISEGSTERYYMRLVDVAGIALTEPTEMLESQG